MTGIPQLITSCINSLSARPGWIAFLLKPGGAILACIKQLISEGRKLFSSLLERTVIIYVRQ